MIDLLSNYNFLIRLMVCPLLFVVFCSKETQSVHHQLYLHACFPTFSEPENQIDDKPDKGD
jgi:hypothetical protein